MAPLARERRPPVGTAAGGPRRRRPQPPGPGWRRPHGNADLWSAQRPGGPRRRSSPPTPGPDGAVRTGTPTSGRHRCAERSERRVPRSRPDHAERRGPGREGTTSDLGVLLAARLRRAVPTGGRRSLASASLCMVAWAPRTCTTRELHFHTRWGAQEDAIMSVSPGGGRHRCAERSERRVPRSRPDDAERRGPGREGTTSDLGVLLAARLRRAVPTRGRRSLASASLCMVAWAPRSAPPGNCTFIPGGVRRRTRS